MATTYYYDPTKNQYNNMDSDLYDMFVSQRILPSNLQKISQQEYVNKQIALGNLDANGKPQQVIIDPKTGAMEDANIRKTRIVDQSLKENPAWTKINDIYLGYKRKFDNNTKLINDSLARIGEIKQNNPVNWQINSALRDEVNVLDQNVRKAQDENERDYGPQMSNYDPKKTAQYIDPSGNTVWDKTKYYNSLPEGITTKTTNADGTTSTNTVNTNTYGSQTPDEWLNKIYNILMPTYSDQIKNTIGPDVMNAFNASVDKPYQEGLKTIMENAASRGTSTAGLTGNQLSEALAAKNLAIQDKQTSMAGDLQTFLDSMAQGGYNSSVKNTSQSIMNAFKASSQSWDDYYNQNQNTINNQLNEQAAQTGLDYQKYVSDNKYNDQNYLDSINAISNLWGTAGQLGGTAAYNFNNKNQTTTKTPITQQVMSNGYSATDSLKNTTSNTLNTNPSTGKQYDWLGY